MQWTSVSCHIIRTDSFKVYDFEKKKLKTLLKMVDQISLTADLWQLGPQRIEYMVQQLILWILIGSLRSECSTLSTCLLHVKVLT